MNDNEILGISDSYYSFFNNGWLENGRKILMNINKDETGYIMIRVKSTSNKNFTFYTKDISSVRLQNDKFCGAFDRDGKVSGADDISEIEISIIGEGNISVSNMARMFYKCGNLSTIKLEGLGTSAVGKMSSMFSGCYSLTEITGVSEFDTSSVTDMFSMFSGCKSLNLDLSKWDFGKVCSEGSGCGCLNMFPSEGSHVVKAKGIVFNKLYKDKGFGGDDDKVYECKLKEGKVVNVTEAK